MPDLEIVRRFDLVSGTVSSVKHTPQGGMIAKASFTRPGVFTYAMPDGSKRRELRHPDEVFSPDSLASYKNAPVTHDHPGRVHPGNWRDHARGHIADSPHVENGHVVGELVLQDGKAIEDAEAGKVKEISMGYECQIDPTPGVYDGQEFDVSQKNIRVNHAAVGPSGWGRLGPSCKLHLDSGAAVSGDEVTDDAALDDDEDGEPPHEDYLGEWVKRNTSPKMPMSERKALGREAAKGAKAEFKTLSNHANKLSANIEKANAIRGMMSKGAQTLSPAHAAAHEAAAAAHKTAYEAGRHLTNEHPVSRGFYDKTEAHAQNMHGHAEAAKGGRDWPPVHTPSPPEPAAEAPKPPPPASMAFPFAAHDVAKQATEHANRMSEKAHGAIVLNELGEASERSAHKEAGEAHLHAAAAHEAAAVASAGQAGGEKGLVQHVKESIGHKEKAAEHAQSAGGEWDESKHPRNENGKFDSLSMDDTHAHFAGEFGSKAREASAKAHEASAKASTPKQHEEASQAHLNAMFANRYAGNAEKDKEHEQLATKHATAAVGTNFNGRDVPLHIRQLAYTAAMEKAHSDHPIFSGPKAEATHFVAVEKVGGKQVARGAGVTRVAAMEHARSLGHHEPLEIQRTTPEHAGAILEKHPHVPSDYEVTKSNFLDAADGLTVAFARGAAAMPSKTDEAPTQAEREKMSEHEFGDPENKKYPLDTPEHIKAASSYVEKEHNSGRLSDAKYKEIRARINKAEKHHGIGEAGAAAGDSASTSRSDRQPYTGGMNEEERKALELAQAKALDAADKLAKAETALTVAKADAAARTDELVTVKSERDLLKLQVGKLTSDAVVVDKKVEETKALEKLVDETIDVRAMGRKVIGDSFKHDGKSVADIKLEVLKTKFPGFADLKVIEDGFKGDAAAQSLAGARLDSLYKLVATTTQTADSARAEVAAISAAPIVRDAGTSGSEDDDEEVDVGKARKAMEKKKCDAWKTPRRIDRMKQKTTDRRSA